MPIVRKLGILRYCGAKGGQTLTHLASVDSCKRSVVDVLSNTVDSAMFAAIDAYKFVYQTDFAPE